MDLLWRREIANSKLLNQNPPTKNRIILEGVYDKLYFKLMADSNEYNIQNIDPGIDGSNKKHVIEYVSKSIKAGTPPPTLGIVDMDGDVNEVSLEKSIKKYSSKQNIKHDELRRFIRDSRSRSCIFSLINSLTDSNWKWLIKIRSELQLGDKWVHEWRVVLKISKFRTSMHAFNQRGEKRPNFAPKEAFSSTIKSSKNFTFQNWSDLWYDNKSRFKNQHLNDHCLEATICDWILQECGVYHERLSILQIQINSILFETLKKEIISNSVTIKKLLDYVGNPFTEY